MPFQAGLSAFDAVDPSDICASVLNSGELMNLKNKNWTCIRKKREFFKINILLAQNSPWIRISMH